MKINSKKLRRYLRKFGLSISQFLMYICSDDTSKAIDLFAGSGTLNQDEARIFINVVGAREAIGLIDWRAMDVRKPSRREIFANAH